MRSPIRKYIYTFLKSRYWMMKRSLTEAGLNRAYGEISGVVSLAYVAGIISYEHYIKYADWFYDRHHEREEELGL